MKIYNFALDGTSNLLNLCIFLRKWKLVEKLVTFRRFIVKDLREMVK